MNLSRKIADAVESLPPGGPLPCPVEAPVAEARLGLHLTARGPVGIAFDRLDRRVGVALPQVDVKLKEKRAEM